MLSSHWHLILTPEADHRELITSLEYSADLGGTLEGETLTT
jgi:hypothetical protein